MAKLKRYLLKCLEPVRENNRPRTPQMMCFGECHNWEFNYRHERWFLIVFRYWNGAGFARLEIAMGFVKELLAFSRNTVGAYRDSVEARVCGG